MDSDCIFERMARFLYHIIAIFFIFSSCTECWRTECANGGDCINGKCLCPDGIERSICQIDTCFKDEKCKNGHCEYGFCVCDEHWIGENCDSLTYSDHSGSYFGSFECNFTTVTTENIIVSGTDDLDTFRLVEERTGYSYYVGFSNRNRFVIPSQRTSGNDENWIAISGTGRINAQEIEMDVRYTQYQFDNLIGYTDCLFDGKKN